MRMPLILLVSVATVHCFTTNAFQKSQKHINEAMKNDAKPKVIVLADSNMDNK